MAPCAPIDVDMGHHGRLGMAWSRVQPSLSLEVFMCWPCPFVYVFKYIISLLRACPKFFAWAPVPPCTWIWGTTAGWKLLGVEYIHRYLLEYPCACSALLHIYSNRVYRYLEPVQNFRHDLLSPHRRGYGASRQAGSGLVKRTSIAIF